MLVLMFHKTQHSRIRFILWNLPNVISCFNCVRTGPPGKPKGPIDVLDVQKDSVQIAWSPPDDDGGKPITYVLLSEL